ncbi:MAG: hypothetical protein K1X83_09365 [Oligoflexia bacterium]|nr:hypothetical protein [Oligoflexia bacterium]
MKIADSISNNEFLSRLEKHLDDVRKGKGYLSAEIGGMLGERHAVNASRLGSLSPQNSLRYGSYYGAFTYDQQARYVDGVNRVVGLLDQLL